MGITFSLCLQSDVRQLRQEKSKAEDKVQELEIVSWLVAVLSQLYFGPQFDPILNGKFYSFFILFPLKVKQFPNVEFKNNVGESSSRNDYFRVVFLKPMLCIACFVFFIQNIYVTKFLLIKHPQIRHRFHNNSQSDRPLTNSL